MISKANCKAWTWGRRSARPGAALQCTTMQVLWSSSSSSSSLDVVSFPIPWSFDCLNISKILLYHWRQGNSHMRSSTKRAKLVSITSDVARILSPACNLRSNGYRSHKGNSLIAWIIIGCLRNNFNCQSFTGRRPDSHMVSGPRDCLPSQAGPSIR